MRIFQPISVKPTVRDSRMWLQFGKPGRCSVEVIPTSEIKVKGRAAVRPVSRLLRQPAVSEENKQMMDQTLHIV